MNFNLSIDKCSKIFLSAKLVLHNAVIVLEDLDLTRTHPTCDIKPWRQELRKEEEREGSWISKEEGKHDFPVCQVWLSDEQLDAEKSPVSNWCIQRKIWALLSNIPLQFQILHY